MAENPDKQPGGEPRFDPRVQTENLAFAPEEMVPCTGCGRANPPNRRACIYCAGEIELRDEDLARGMAQLHAEFFG